jgi:nicotinate-nucleotide pyrophosphorylase (carboxylating)
MNYYKNFNWRECDRLIRLALQEDVGKGDVTSEFLIPKSEKSRAIILIKESGVIAGLKIFERVFKLIDKNVKVKIFVKDGDKVKKGKVAVEVSGKTRSLLMGERLSLNIIQRMSGIATMVNEAARRLNNKNIKILDTRKTTPNFRIFEKLAVKIGGGENHRFGLYDMMLIKDNHIEANDGIENVLKKLKGFRKKVKIEIEVKNLDELKLVIEKGRGLVDRVMFDNFNLNDLKKAAKMVNGKFEIEISGGVNLANIRKYSKFHGIDYISSGALTHSNKSLDISLDFIS